MSPYYAEEPISMDYVNPQVPATVPTPDRGRVADELRRFGFLR